MNAELNSHKALVTFNMCIPLSSFVQRRNLLLITCKTPYKWYVRFSDILWGNLTPRLQWDKAATAACGPRRTWEPDWIAGRDVFLLARCIPAGTTEDTRCIITLLTKINLSSVAWVSFVDSVIRHIFVWANRWHIATIDAEMNLSEIQFEAMAIESTSQWCHGSIRDENGQLN